MRSEGKTAAIILAAGCSSRAPGFKPLLPLGDSTVLEKSAAIFRRAKVAYITVVTGHQAGALKPLLERLELEHVYNAGYAHGMFSSVSCGLRAVKPGVAAFFLLPVDMPLVKSHTVKMLARAFNRADADIIYPVFQGQRGHPPLIAAHLIPAILAWNGPEGLRGFLKQYESRAYEVNVLDEGTVMDIDTAEDYAQCMERYRKRNIPAVAECEAIMAKLEISYTICRHSRMVAAVAEKLASCINRAGPKLDISLIVAGSLLHDVAKGQPNHAQEGARLVKRLGYPKVAHIVGEHTDLALWDGASVDEAAVVYLADKLVKQDQIVSLRDKFQNSLERFAEDPAAQSAIRRRLATAQSIAKLLEQLLGTNLAQVISDERWPFYGYADT